MKTAHEEALVRAAPDEMPTEEVSAQALRLFIEQACRAHPASRRVLSRRALVLLVGALLVGAVAVPSVAVRSGWRPFNEADPASPVVFKRFETLFGAPAPSGMDPRVVPISTRRVTVFRLADGDHGLWVAPTKTGGYCRVFDGLGGGCVTRVSPLVVPEDGETAPWLIHAAVRGNTREAAPDLIGGEVLSTDVARLP